MPGTLVPGGGRTAAQHTGGKARIAIMGASSRSRPRGSARGFVRTTAVVASLALAVGTAQAAGAATSPSAGSKVASHPSATTNQTSLTQAQAQTRAEKTGKAVPIPAATTANSTLTALPDGKFQLTDSLMPQRAKVDGAWQPLDANLSRNADGTLSPKVSSNPVRISDGGTGALAVMEQGGSSMTLALPAGISALPKPTLSGATATYPNVLPGVSLIVTVDDTGGFSEVFKIADAQAAVPALADLDFPVRTGGGVKLTADASGNLDATAAGGRTLFSAPIPRMWDSATSAAAQVNAVTDPQDGVKVDKTTGVPVASSADGAGVAAHTAQLGVSLSGGHLSLRADSGLLHGSKTVWPMYIDPSYSQGSDANSWTYTSSEYPTAKNWDISTSDDYLHAGYINSSYDTDDYTSNDIAYLQYNLGGFKNFYGSTVSSATLYTTDEWSDSCTTRQTDLYWTGGITPTTSAGAAPGQIQDLENQTFAHGANSTCPVGPVNWISTTQSNPALTAALQTSANDSSKQITFALRADDETDPLTWRKFSQATAELSVVYDKPPYTPTAADMSTSPATDCAATAANPVGLGNMTLYSSIGSPMGTQNALHYAFRLWKGSSTESSGTLLDSTSFSSTSSPTGSIVSLPIPESDFTSSGWTGGQVTEFYWDLQVNDTILSSSWSPTCDFYYDPTIPGPPQFTDASTQCGTGTAIGTAGTGIAFPVTYNTDGAQPTDYSYQLDGEPAVTKAANAGALTISVDPTRRDNILTVTSLSSGGNVSIGQPATCEFTVGAPATAADKDMNGDGVPDVVFTGQDTAQSETYTNPGSGNPETGVLVDGSSADSVDPGLWQAEGQTDADSGAETDGQVQDNATQIGSYGDGTSAIADAASFDGYQAITGQFTDDGFTDVLLYDPELGQGQVLASPGDGSVLPADVSGNEHDILSGSLSAMDVNQDAPLQVVNAYNAAGDDLTYPDLLAINGDSSVGFYLDYYESNGSAGVYSQPTQLSIDTPDGTADWQNWYIASDSENGSLNLLLWDQSTGQLIEWYDTTLSSTGTLGYAAAYTLAASGFETGQDLASLQLADAGTDAGSNGALVWAVTTGGTVIPYVYSDLSGTPTGVAGAQDPLQTPAHSWALNDGTTGVATSATDTAGGMPLGSMGSGVTWSTADKNFNPDVILNGTSTGYLQTGASTSGFTPEDSWSVQAWVDPTKLGGTVFSENGLDDSAIMVSSTTGGVWSASMNTGGTTSASYDTMTGGTAQTGVWTELTLTYDASNGADIMKLYANGVEVTSLQDTAPPVDGARFLVGADQVATVGASFFTGQVADVQIWDTVAVPPQPITAGSVYVPVTPVRIMDTRTASLDDGTLGPVAAYSTTSLPIDGNNTNGAGLPSSGITAVDISVTSAAETSAGFISVYPGDTPQPLTSTVNYASNGNSFTNGTIVPVGADGAVNLYNASPGTAQLIVDLDGYFTTNTAATGASSYVALKTPTRIASKATIGAGASVAETIAGLTVSGVTVPSGPTVPSGSVTIPSGVTAIAANLTAINTANQTGHMNAYRDGDACACDGITNLTYGPDASQAAMALIPVGADGKIEIYNYSAAAITFDLDLSGYFTAGSGAQLYHPLDSTRIIDTRQTSALAAGQTMNVTLPDNIPADNPVLVANITETGSTTFGDLSAYPEADALPGTSSVNWGTGLIVPNLALVDTHSDNSFNIVNQSNGSCNVVVDTNGYFEFE